MPELWAMLFSRNLLDLNLLGAIPDSFGNASSNARHCHTWFGFLPVYIWLMVLTEIPG